MGSSYGCVSVFLFFSGWPNRWIPVGGRRTPWMHGCMDGQREMDDDEDNDNGEDRWRD